MQTIAITGASGFIGKKLVMYLQSTGEYEVRVLSRNRQRDLTERRFAPGVEIIEGDIGDVNVLMALVKPGCTVINLAYLWDAGEKKNLEVINSLLTVCGKMAVRRLIHCSTAAVAGRVMENRITEATPCNPVTEYGVTKLKIEQAVVNAAAQKFFDAVIVRPTAVYGIEGEQMKKLMNDLTMGNRWLNYMKSCLFGERRMNLVHVDNLVAAIVFLIRYPQQLEGQIYFVSEDDNPDNNFSYIEQSLINGLALKSIPLPKLKLPSWLLAALLAIRGRNNINPNCTYSPDKLLGLGYKRPRSLESGLTEYVNWCCSAGFQRKKENI